MNFKKTIAGISSLVLTMSMATAFPASAKGTILHSADEVVPSLNTISQKALISMIEGESESPAVSTYTVDNPANVPTAPIPEKFDLRDVEGKNFVTPVKLQNPYGTCWAFACIAAAETSIAANLLDVDMNTATDAEKAMVDFSERHLAWFVNTPLSDTSALYPSQAGEGMLNRGVLESEKELTQREFNDFMFNTGGYMAYATSVFSSYQGPVQESVAPYTNDEGILEGGIVVVKVDALPDSSATEEERTEFLKNMFSTVTYIMYDGTTSEDALPVLKENNLLDSEGNPKFISTDNVDDTDAWFTGPGYYVLGIGEPIDVSSNGTWAVDESQRFQSAFELTQSNMLPSPSTIDENGAYKFNIDGVNAIKQEVLNGNAVSIAFKADQSMPGDTIDENSFMSFIDENGNRATNEESAAYWCQYTYDRNYDPSDPESINKTVSSNHAVTIIGYDDNFPKEYFNDPNGTIGGNGAFIIKNSWGSNEINSPWGSGGTGYFYLSYYDQSIWGPESFTFESRGGEKDGDIYLRTNQMYDLMPGDLYQELAFDQDTSMVNVFTADKNMILSSVGYTAVTANEQVSYDVYLIDENDKLPTDGELVSHAEATYQYGGFQRTDLETPVAINAGQKYAVSVTVKREDGNYGVGLKAGYNDKALDYIKDEYVKNRDTLAKELEELKASPDADKAEIKQLENDIATFDQAIEWTQTGAYGNAVVNQGESLLCIGDTWTDWADVMAEKDDTEYGKCFEFDNFGIKTFAESEAVTIVNAVAGVRESYGVGETVPCTVTVKNNMDEDLDSIVLYLDGEKLEAVKTLKPGESTVVNYNYKITEEDVKNGKFETTASVNLEDEDFHIPMYLMDEFSTPTMTFSITEAEHSIDPTEKQPDTEPSEDNTEPTEEIIMPETQPSTKPAKDYATLEQFAKMAKVDYEKKYGVAVTPEAVKNDDGTVTVTLKDADGNLVDTYILDAKTGIGKDAKDAEVNLPQTGVTSWNTALTAGSAFALTVTGLWLTLKAVRKKDEE